MHVTLRKHKRKVEPGIVAACFAVCPVSYKLQCILSKTWISKRKISFAVAFLELVHGKIHPIGQFVKQCMWSFYFFSFWRLVMLNTSIDVKVTVLFGANVDASICGCIQSKAGLHHSVGVFTCVSFSPFSFLLQQSWLCQ